MIVRATPWLRCGVRPSASIRSRTCWTTSGVGCGFNSMIIVLKPHPTPEVVQHVLERIEALGLTPHLSQGVARTIIGVIGDEDKLQAEPLQAIDGVEQV